MNGGYVCPRRRCAHRSCRASQKQAAEAYTPAEQHELNPRSVWSCAQELPRLRQRISWQDALAALDRVASRFVTTVH